MQMRQALASAECGVSYSNIAVMCTLEAVGALPGAPLLLLLTVVVHASHTLPATLLEL